MKEKIKKLIKKGKWLNNMLLTLLLIAIVVAVTVGINVFVEKQNISSIDLTKEKLYSKYCFVKLVVSFFLLTFEAILLHDIDRLDSNILLSCVPLTYYLFISAVYIAKNIKLKFPFGDYSKYYYLIHPVIIFAISLLFENISNYPYLNIFMVLLITHIISFLIVKLKSKNKLNINLNKNVKELGKI